MNAIEEDREDVAQEREEARKLAQVDMTPQSWNGALCHSKGLAMSAQGLRLAMDEWERSGKVPDLYTFADEWDALQNVQKHSRLLFVARRVLDGALDLGDLRIAVDEHTALMKGPPPPEGWTAYCARNWRHRLPERYRPSLRQEDGLYEIFLYPDDPAYQAAEQHLTKRLFSALSAGYSFIGRPEDYARFEAAISTKVLS